MSKLTIAVSQIDLVLGKPQKNLETIQTDIVHAKLHGADVIVLPELWSSHNHPGGEPDSYMRFLWFE